jgi:hypothetical protein
MITDNNGSIGAKYQVFGVPLGSENQMKPHIKIKNRSKLYFFL